MQITAAARPSGRISAFAAAIVSSVRIRSRCTGRLAVMTRDLGAPATRTIASYLAGAVRAHLGDEHPVDGVSPLLVDGPREPGEVVPARRCG